MVPGDRTNRRPYQYRFGHIWNREPIEHKPGSCQPGDGEPFSFSPHALEMPAYQRVFKNFGSSLRYAQRYANLPCRPNWEAANHDMFASIAKTISPPPLEFSSIFR